MSSIAASKSALVSLFHFPTRLSWQEESFWCFNKTFSRSWDYCHFSQWSLGALCTVQFPLGHVSGLALQWGLPACSGRLSKSSVICSPTICWEVRWESEAEAKFWRTFHAIVPEINDKFLKADREPLKGFQASDRARSALYKINCAQWAGWTAGKLYKKATELINERLGVSKPRLWPSRRKSHL